jgi:hypothetical protein
VVKHNSPQINLKRFIIVLGNFYMEFPNNFFTKPDFNFMKKSSQALGLFKISENYS